MTVADEQKSPKHRLTRWLLQGSRELAGAQTGPHATRHEKTHPWWQVMCLTGVDYFSTLGYQPAIAALAAGLLSPMATIVLVALTLFGALPVYRWVARHSYRGEGSVAMLEKLLPWWSGKLFVLVLLGFAATSFTITITLSASDAAAHAVENPLVPSWLHGANVPITLILIALLGGVFLRGFRDAIRIAVVLVIVYLALNTVVIVDSLVHVAAHPAVISDWWSVLLRQNGNPLVMVGIALVVFPRLALGLSGFETGVVVMPQIDGEDDPKTGKPEKRIQGTKRLLTTAALIMSAFLITSSLVTTLLIPQKEFQAGGQANGRALAYLAHEYLGPVFGTAYDISTICILWFAGASAMAGLLNLVPRFLPRYGMAPQWAGAVRPLAVLFTIIAMIVTLAFKASVDGQGGAYATGVLVLISSAAVASFLSALRQRRRAYAVLFAVVSAVLLYTTVVNVIERPDGVQIASMFILGILSVSLISRAVRSFELRATSVRFDEVATDWIEEEAEEFGAIRVLANEPDDGSREEYAQKLADERRDSGIPSRASVLFLEVLPGDSSDFEEDLVVRGVARHGYRVLTVRSGNVPNTIASILLEMRGLTGVVPDVYFEWTEGNPLSNMFRYLVTGVGEVAPVTREVLRRAEPVITRRPDVHVS